MNDKFRKTSWILFWILLIVPRVLRIIAPDVQIEDPVYIYNGFLIMKGLVPFAEFAQVNPPLLETLLAQLYTVFGVSYRIPEILSAGAFLLSAVLILRLGTRLSDRTTGMAAALLYSWHFLVFRYHVFERETFMTLAVLTGIDVLLQAEDRNLRPFLSGLMMGIGFACKQTALIPFLAVAGVTALLQRRWKQTALLCIGFGLFTGLLTLSYSMVFGRMFMDQIFWFHWIKGYVAPWNVKALWIGAELGFILPLMIAGLGTLRHPARDANWIWPAMITADLVFFWFISGTIWPHNLLSMLPAAALLAGRIVSAIVALACQPKTATQASGDTGMETKCFSRNRSAVSLAILAACVAAVQAGLPGSLFGSGSTQHFGFSGTPRREVADATRAIRDHTKESDLIISDSFIGLEARRIKVVRDKETWGLILWMQRMMERGEYREAVSKLSKQPFGEILLKSHQYWMPLIETAFASGEVGAVQPNYELPLDGTQLVAAGMRIVYQSPYYTIWARTPPPEE